MSNHQITASAAFDVAPVALTDDELAAEIAALTEAQDDDSIDFYATLIDEARPTYTDEDWAKIAAAFDICPTHHCDTDICADDAADCEAGTR